MTTRKFGRTALIAVLALSIIMSITGGTIAWFTDEVTSASNIIQSGTLDADVYYGNPEDKESIQDKETLFDSVTLWEPGAVAWENLTVVNNGTLDLQYQMTMNAINENTVTVDGTDYCLSQVLKAAIVEGGVTQTERDSLIGVIDAAEWKSFADFKVTGDLKAAEAGKTYGVVIYWQPGANDNNWNVNNGRKVSDYDATGNNNYLHIDLGVTLKATQLASEADSFDNQYDAGAGFENGNDSGNTEKSGFPITWNALNVKDNEGIEYENKPFVKISDFTPNGMQLHSSNCTFYYGEYVDLPCTVSKINGFWFADYEDVMLCIIIPATGVYDEFGSAPVAAGFYVYNLNGDDDIVETIDVDFTIDTSYQGNVDDSFDMSDVSPNLADNDWETIQKVIQAGKAMDAGWEIGDISPEFTYNNQTFTARIIGMNQDGDNTVTFMLTSSLGYYEMNNYSKSDKGEWNLGGYIASDANNWLDNTVYNGLSSDLKSVIKTVEKRNTCDPSNPTGITSASYHLFLLSVEEIGLLEEFESNTYYQSLFEDMTIIDRESDFTYTYFQTNDMAKRRELTTSANRHMWLRSTFSANNSCFFKVDLNGQLDYYNGYIDYIMLPAFVVG